MVAIGLMVTGGELMRTLRDRRLMSRSLLVNCILIPLLGYALVQLIPVSDDMKVGILLLAILPGTPLALNFTRQARNRLAIVASLTFVLCFVAAVMTPVALELAPSIHHQGYPLLRFLRDLLVYIVIPLWTGLLLTRWLGEKARKLVLPLNIFATICFFWLLLETRDIRRQALHIVAGWPMIALLLLIVISMVLGWYFGGPDRETRRVLATSSSMRSVILCFYIAKAWFPGTDVIAVPIAFIAMALPINFTFTLYEKWQVRRDKKAAATA